MLGENLNKVTDTNDLDFSLITNMVGGVEMPLVLIFHQQSDI